LLRRNLIRIGAAGLVLILTAAAATAKVFHPTQRIAPAPKTHVVSHHTTHTMPKVHAAPLTSSDTGSGDQGSVDDSSGDQAGPNDQGDTQDQSGQSGDQGDTQDQSGQSGDQGGSSSSGD
jgi:hypothetical protein